MVMTTAMAFMAMTMIAATELGDSYDDGGSSVIDQDDAGEHLLPLQVSCRACAA